MWKNCAKFWILLKMYTWNIPPETPLFSFLNTLLHMKIILLSYSHFCSLCCCSSSRMFFWPYEQAHIKKKLWVGDLIDILTFSDVIWVGIDPRGMWTAEHTMNVLKRRSLGPQHREYKGDISCSAACTDVRLVNGTAGRSNGFAAH